MEKTLYICIVVGGLFLLISILLWFIKKTAFLVVSIIIAVLFFAKSGMSYMELDYLKEQKEKMETGIQDFQDNLEGMDLLNP